MLEPASFSPDDHVAPYSGLSPTTSYSYPDDHHSDDHPYSHNSTSVDNSSEKGYFEVFEYKSEPEKDELYGMSVKSPPAEPHLTCSCQEPCQNHDTSHRRLRYFRPSGTPPTLIVKLPPPSPSTFERAPEEPEVEGQVQNACLVSPSESQDSRVCSGKLSVTSTVQEIKADDDLYLCTNCIANRKLLKAHQRRQDRKNSGRYQCPVCRKNFVQHSSLTTHMHVHTGQKPYSCTDCSRKFEDFSTFTKHKRTHAGVKPYVCTVCKLAFTQIGNLHRHVKAVHKTVHSLKTTVY